MTGPQTICNIKFGVSCFQHYKVIAMKVDRVMFAIYDFKDRYTLDHLEIH